MTKYVKTDKYFTITTKYGQTVIEFFPHKAPNHVKRIQELIEEGYYNGLKFHRVIDAFMAQTGCSKGDGTGGSNKPDLKAEFNDVEHERGIVSMARKGHSYDSANSQFFIMLDDAPYLDGQYTAFGQVVHGMDCIDRIKKGEGGNGMVINPDVIIEIHLGLPEDISV